jgi:hypothetical protein
MKGGKIESFKQALLSHRIKLMGSDFKGKIGIIRRRRDLHIDAEARKPSERSLRS